MAIRSEAWIEQDIYDALTGFFDGKISGAFLPSGTRPANSKLEDAIIKVTSTSADQIQNGRAKLNIYVPNVDIGWGRPVPDKGRIQDISALDEEIISVLNASNTDYNFYLSQATAVIEDAEIDQYFVNINIEFKRKTF